MEISFFDFDGTVTNKDSMVDFIQCAVGRTSYYRGLLILSPMLLAYKLKLIPNYAAKEMLLSHYFKGWDEASFRNISDKYSIEHIDKIIRPKAKDKMRWHQKNGHKVVIVSASLESWLSKWCERNEVDLIATQHEVKNGKVTGKFSSKNCYGSEKVNRIKQRYNLSEYSFIYAYGDSPGDKEMLSIANVQHYKCFD